MLVHDQKVLWYGPSFMALWGMHWPPGTLPHQKLSCIECEGNVAGPVWGRYCYGSAHDYFIVTLFTISWRALSRVFEWSDQLDFMTLLGRPELRQYWHNDQDLLFWLSNISLAHTAWSRCSHNVLGKGMQLKRTSGQTAWGVCCSRISESYQPVSAVTELESHMSWKSPQKLQPPADSELLEDFQKQSSAHPQILSFSSMT